MSNVIANSSIVCKKALMVLENMLEFTANANRDYEPEFAASFGRGYAPGNTINIKKPPRYTYRSGRVAAPQATTESTVPLVLQQGGCDLSFTTNERTTGLTMDALEDKLQAAIAPVANEIDRAGLELAHYSVFNALNPTYAAPNTQVLAVGAATALNRRLDDMACPRDRQRSLTMSPGLNENLITGTVGLFNAQAKISEQYGTGIMVDALGIRYHLDQNVAVHTNGAATASNINGANQTGATITVAAIGAGTLTKGTVITLPGTFAVNPQSRQSTGVLAQFVVTADVAVGGTSIPISPAIVTSGAFQNVTASPTTAQPFVIFGAASTSYSCSIAHHKTAFTLASVPLEMPTKGSGVIAHQETHNGLTLMVTEGYDIIAGASIMRIDCLWGWAATYPELACKWAL